MLVPCTKGGWKSAHAKFHCKPHFLQKARQQRSCMDPPSSFPFRVVINVVSRRNKYPLLFINEVPKGFFCVSNGKSPSFPCCFFPKYRKAASACQTLKKTSPQTDVCSDASGSGTKLFAKTQSFNDGAVSFDILLHEVIQKTAALTNHFQKTTTGMMVFLVVLQVFCQIADAFRKNGNLTSGDPVSASLMR